MSKLWDELESIRPDCAFLFITHDIDFACSRVADKYVISAYEPTPIWDITAISNNSDFDERTLTLILGSRKPILFVEGNGGSLDLATYRCFYPDYTVIPQGSCQSVIHSVTSFNASDNLTRLSCRGIIDADGLGDENFLNERDIKILPVVEIENIFMHPDVVEAMLRHENYPADEISTKLEEYKRAIFEKINKKSIEDVCLRHTRRVIDRQVKRLDLSEALNADELSKEFDEKISAIKPKDIYQNTHNQIQTAIQSKDIEKLLKIYDNKGLLAIVASHAKGTNRDNFVEWLIRTLNNKNDSPLFQAIKKLLPTID